MVELVAATAADEVALTVLEMGAKMVVYAVLGLEEVMVAVVVVDTADLLVVVTVAAMEMEMEAALVREAVAVLVETTAAQEEVVHRARRRQQRASCDPCSQAQRRPP